MSDKEKEYLSALNEAYTLKPSTLSIMLLKIIAGLILFLLLWASFSKIEELTRGQGQVIPFKKTQIIQSLEGGIVKELLVSEGDIVKQGDILFRLSDISFSAQEQGTKAQFYSLTLQKERLTSEIQNVPFIVPNDIAIDASDIAANELRLFQSRKEELENALNILNDRIESISAQLNEADADIDRLTTSKELLDKELEITKRIVKDGAAPEIELLALRRGYADTSGRLEAAKERRKALLSDYSAAKIELENEKDAFKTRALSELSEIETNLVRATEDLKSLKDRVDRTSLRAPVSGIVNKIYINTIGGVMQPGQPIAEIVPLGDNLKVVARIEPNNIAFIEKGQPAKVKITAYDPIRYGHLEGKVSRVGANTVEDAESNLFFEIEVITDKTYLGSDKYPLPITPGMVADIEVITGKRSIMSYLLKPITRAFSRALTER